MLTIMTLTPLAILLVFIVSTAGVSAEASGSVVAYPTAMAEIPETIELCTDVNFGGDCIKLPMGNAFCVCFTEATGLAMLNHQVSSVKFSHIRSGGGTCKFYREDNCDNEHAMVVESLESKGISNLQDTGFDNAMSCFQCFDSEGGKR